MDLEGENVLLRIFLDTFQTWHHRPAYEVIVERARAEGVAGATVLAAIEGLGPEGDVLKESRWRLANDREVVVEVVDKPEKINRFLGAVDPMLEGAVVTLERARVIFYRANREEREP